MTAGLNPVKPEATFSRSLGQACIKNVIYYSITLGIKLWHKGTQSIPIKFNFTVEEVYQYHQVLTEQDPNMVWNSDIILGIRTTADTYGTDLNLFDNHGQMIASEITIDAKFYVDIDSRMTKINYQIYHFLKISLLVSGTAKITSKNTKYHILSNPCGDFLLNLLHQKYIIDTTDTSYNLRENMSSLDTYITTVKSIIEWYN